MKILYLSSATMLGGAERSLLDLMTAVARSEPMAALRLLVPSDGPLVEQARRLGVETKVLAMPVDLLETGDHSLQTLGDPRRLLNLLCGGPARALAVWSYIRQLREAVQRLQPTVIHSNGIKFHLLTGLAGLERFPVIWHMRDFIVARRLVARALGWASNYARAGIAISRAVASDCSAAFDSLPVEVVYNGIDTSYFSPGPVDPRLLDTLAGMPVSPAKTIRVGLVATYARWKGQLTFLEAAARLAKAADAIFYVVGGPIYRTHGSQFSRREFEDRVVALGLGERVRFVDFQNEPADIYRSLDVVVHASTKPEPFGRTIAEGMACGKPVIVAEGGGASELFTNGFDALGVRPGDPQALASAIRQLIENPHQRRRLGENARQSAQLKFDRNRLGPQITSLYHRVLKTPYPRLKTFKQSA